MSNDKNLILQKFIEFEKKNSISNRPLIKILVGYIKPSFLFKSEILTPIHLGRAVAQEKQKDGNISDSDLKWLYTNCIGDDNFDDNISNVNRRVGFLTGTYWAWKNYKKLGNPEYIGLCGYRRMLNPNFLTDLTSFDFVMPNKEKLRFPSNKEQFIKYHSENLFDSMVKNYNKLHKEDIDQFNYYLNMSYGYYHELYIMKKKIFFDFCDWIFPLLNSFLQDKECYCKCNSNEMSALSFFHGIAPETRDIAYIVELLTGYYLYKLSLNNKLKSKEYDLTILNENVSNDKKRIFGFLRKHLKEDV